MPKYERILDVCLDLVDFRHRVLSNSMRNCSPQHIAFQTNILGIVSRKEGGTFYRLLLQLPDLGSMYTEFNQY